MKEKKISQTAGITLMALTITIIVMLILAGITISTAIGEGGFIGKAEQSQITEIIEKYRAQIDGVHVKWATDSALNDNITVDHFWIMLEDRNIIADRTKDVEKLDEEGLYQITTVDGYVFELYIDESKTELTYIGKNDKLLPVIRAITVTGKSTSTIDIQVKGSRLDSGSLSYYYKKTSEENYTELKTKTTDITASYTGLEHHTSYDIKVVATNKNGSNESIIQVTTRKIGEATEGLQEGVIIASTPTWNNGTASITLSTTTGLTIQWQKNGISGTWTTGTSVTGINHNETIFARLTDGNNYGDEASVLIIDGTAPSVIVTQGAITTKSIAVSVSSSDAQTGMVASPSYSYYIKKTSDSNYPTTASYTGTNTSYTFNNLAQTTSYDIKVTTQDIAGNIGTGIITNVTTGTVGGATSGLKTGNIVASNPTWSNGTASITLSTTTGLSIQWQKGGTTEGNWTTGNSVTGINHNETVFARLTDGNNYGDEASITIIDGTAPSVTVTQGTITTKSIAVSVSSSDAQTGMAASPSYSYYIKKTSEGSYPTTASYTGTNTSYTFDNLEHKTSYDMKVTTQDIAGNVGTEIITNVTTNTLGGATSGLATGNIIASSPTWSNGTASITLSTTTGLTIQWQKGGIAEGNWTTGTGVTGINHNTTVFARLTDGKNYGDEASVTILDGNNPQEATISLGATSANTGVNVTATVTHNDNESGPNIASCKWVYNTTSGAIGTNSSSYTETFSSNGQTISLTASTPGSYYLHVLTVDKAGRAKESIKGPITVKQLVTGITVSPTSATIYVGNTQNLTATISPSNASNKNVTWTSNNTGVATVNNGVVTGISAGTATITATAADGSGKSATCNITVIQPVAPVVKSTKVGSKTTNSIVVEATATDENNDKLTYQLYTSTLANSGFSLKATSVAAVSGTQVTLTASSLSDYTTYYYYVTVTDGIYTATSNTSSVRTYCPVTTYYCNGGTISTKSCSTCGGNSYYYLCPRCEFEMFYDHQDCWRCGFPWHMLEQVQCSSCSGTGTITTTTACSHGSISAHYYDQCPHGYTNQHD